MAVPDFQTMMLPFLQLVADKGEHGYAEISNAIASHYGLSDTDKNELVPSGRHTRLINRVHWVSTYFKKALLIALQGRRATKGVFITTSDYSKGAMDFAASINNKIILIGGDELADLMMDYNVGVSVAETYEIKNIDSDYFVEE